MAAVIQATREAMVGRTEVAGVSRGKKKPHETLSQWKKLGMVARTCHKPKIKRIARQASLGKK
jgi:hypothetical protein